MRTKTLLLAAALGAAGIASSMAQSVYSVNAVGYINLTCQPGYNLLANQLNGTNNAIGTVLPSVPGGTRVLKWDSSIQDFINLGFIEGFGWVDESTAEPTAAPLNPGDGFFLQNNGATPFTVTLVGEVPQGTNLTVTVGANYSLISSIVPKVPNFTPAGGFPASGGMRCLRWSTAIGDYVNYGYIDGFGWVDESTAEPADPSPAVGEGVFIQNNGSSVNWVTSFSVN